MSNVRGWHYFAGGTWHEPISGRWFESSDPTHGAVWARVPDCEAEDVAVAVAAARAAFEEGAYARMNATERGRLLRRMADAVRGRADSLGLTETTDNGKHLAGIRDALSGWLTDSLDYCAGIADKVEGSVIPVDCPDILNYTQREPYGVVACITTWNSPLLIAIWKISAAIAAGNTVVIKPSEFASVSTLALMGVLQDADMPPGVLNVVTGTGEVAGAALISHPDVRLISFTGGLAGGRAVARAAGDLVKPVILELGGKSPQIVLEDADLDLAVRGIAGGIFPPTGQSCIAGSRVLVHQSLHDALVERLIALSTQARIGDPRDPGTHIGPIANEPHFVRVSSAIADARQTEATCVLGGEPAHPEGCGGWFLPPTIFTGVAPDQPLAREEIFGPVLAVMPISDEEEAVAVANATDYGLAAGIWTKDTARAIRLADRIGAGTVYINTYFGSAPQSPVGGYKLSGFGRENGHEGVRAFQQTKSVWLATRQDQPNPFA